jgi:hypothetical protein
LSSPPASPIASAFSPHAAIAAIAARTARRDEFTRSRLATMQRYQRATLLDAWAVLRLAAPTRVRPERMRLPTPGAR